MRVRQANKQRLDPPDGDAHILGRLLVCFVRNDSSASSFRFRCAKSACGLPFNKGAGLPPDVLAPSFRNC
jgi:hypothetical protein